MTTQYTPILKLALPVQGELSGSWGDVVNDNITEMVEEAVAGLATINSWTANSHTLTTANGTTSESRCAVLVADDDGGGNPSAAATIICPAATKLYVLKNISGQQVTLKTSGGTGVAVPNGSTAFLFCDGTNVEACQTDIINATTIDTTNLEVTNIKAKDGTASGSIANSTGVFTINSAVLTTADINGGTIDGVTIGGASSGAGTFSTMTTSNAVITGGSVTGITDLAVADGGTGASTTANARTNLGLAIGVDVQAYDADLTAIGALAKTDGNFIVGDGTTWVAESGATARTSLGLASGATTTVGTIATQNSNSVSITGGSITGITDLAVADGGTGASDAATARSNLGLAIGSDVQAYDADTLKADVADTLTVGFSATAYSAGTYSSGTFTPDVDLGNFQYVTNGGAHTLGVPSKNCTMVILYKNNGTAGAITTTSYTLVDGDDLTTTNGDEFFFYITRINDGATTFSLLTVKALQ